MFVGEPLSTSCSQCKLLQILYNYWLTKRIPPLTYGGSRILRDRFPPMNMNVTRRIMAVGAVGVFGLVLVGVLYFYGLGFRTASGRRATMPRGLRALPSSCR